MLEKVTEAAEAAPLDRETAEFEAVRALYRYDRSLQFERYIQQGDGIPLKSIGISITENCQLQCRWCHLAEIGFNKTYLSPADFEALLESCGELDDIHLTPAGEAFLHPQFIDILKICRRVQPQAKTRVITNGIYSLGGGRADLPAYLDHVAFSVDGATKETFELIRKPAKFENFLESVRRFVTYKETHQTDAVYKFIFTASKVNLPELTQLVELAADLRQIKAIVVAPVRLRTASMRRFSDELLDAMDDDERCAHLDRARARAKELGIGLIITKNCYPDRFVGSADVVDDEIDEEEAQSEGADNLPFLEFCNEPWNGGMRVYREPYPCCYMRARIRENPDLKKELFARYGFGEPIEDYSEFHPSSFYNSEGFWRFRQDMMTGEAARFCGNCTIARGNYKAYAAGARNRVEPTNLKRRLQRQTKVIDEQKERIAQLRKHRKKLRAKSKRQSGVFLRLRRAGRRLLKARLP